MGEINLLDPRAIDDPHGYFRQFRDGGPIQWSDRHRAWIVMGHPELNAAFRDPRLSTERMSGFRERLSGPRAEALSMAIDLLDGWMLFHEPPEHTRLRGPLARSFTPRSVNALEDRVQQIVDDLLDKMAATSGGDLVELLTHPLPAAVIAELFGVPIDERDWLANWSEKFGVVVFGAVGRDDYDEVAREAGAELEGRLQPLFDRYRTEPEDNLLSLLLAEENEVDGRTRIELLGACSLLLFAGHDTTASLLGSATVALCKNPDVRRAFTTLEGDDLDIAVEELLRFEAPAKAMMRTVVEDHEDSGVGMRTGQSVFLNILAANRDDRVFDSPDDIVLGRDPNPHLTFGFGHHFCLGAALARLEAKVTFSSLFQRFPNLQLDGDPTWRPTISDRSPKSVPLRW